MELIRKFFRFLLGEDLGRRQLVQEISNLEWRVRRLERERNAQAYLDLQARPRTYATKEAMDALGVSHNAEYEGCGR